MDTDEIVLIDYPKYFSPNGDGYNDLWSIFSLGQHPDFKIFIFDGYGKLLKQLSKKDEGWDGTFSGVKMPADEYWFTLELVNGKMYKNHFSLIR